MSSGKKSSLTVRVLSAIAMLGSAQAVNIACSVIRTKLIAVWLGPVGVGLNTILVNGSTLVSTATQLNIRDSAVRDLSVPAAPGRMALKTAVVRRWALILGIIGAVAMIIASPVLSVSAYSGSLTFTPWFAALAPGVFFAAYSAGEFAVLQARERLSRIARANVMAGIAATAIAVPLLYFMRLKAIVIIINVYAFAVAACVWYRRERPAAQISVRLNAATLWREGRSFLGLGLTIAFSVLLTTMMNYVFAAYINSHGGETALGIYQSGYTLVNSYVGIIFSAVAVEYYPRLTRFIGRPAAARTVMAHEVSIIVRLVTPVAVIFVLASDFIVRLLYSSSFDGVVPFVTFAIVGALYRGISLCYAYRILAAGDSRAYIFTETASVITGLTLNIIAYTHWSYAGLGISYIIWYAFYTALTAAVCRIRYGVSLPRRLVWLSLGATAVISAAIVLKYFVIN